ncbi:MAG: deoxyribonuclease II family protein, partial [Fibrobacterota bacterium]
MLLSRSRTPLALLCAGLVTLTAPNAYTAPVPAPRPLIAADHPVDWWFAFKLNSAKFPGCAGAAEQACVFGGSVQHGKKYGQQFVYASSAAPSLREGSTCLGDDTLVDPLGASFQQVYAGNYNYVIWNDQFYNDPVIPGCGKSCSAPWGHSKGLVAWNDSGAGFVLQVSTPSWPASASKDHPRESDGNTLGCIKDNNIRLSQHFFALRLTKDDLVLALRGIQNASVVTDPSNPQIVRNGGPEDVQKLVQGLGQKSSSHTATHTMLSTGVELISKPSQLHVPPWQMVSSILSGVPLRTASWWNRTSIATTTAETPIGCWDSTLDKPGAVEIATTGQWNSVRFSLKG